MEYRVEWLGSFVGVAEHGGFSAAAAALSRSQSRVSTHVAALEKALHMRLFDRSVQPTVLTPEGRALLPHARTVLRQLRALPGTAAEVRRGLRGEVRLGVHAGVAPFLLPRTMMRVQQSQPGLRLSVREQGAAQLEARLLDGRLDLAVGPGGPAGARADARLARVRLWREQLMAVVREESAGTLPARPCPADLVDRPLAVVDVDQPLAVVDVDQPLAVVDEVAGPNAPAALRAAFTGTGRTAPVFSTPQAQTMVGLVRQGWGVGVAEVLSLSTADLRGVTLLPLTGTPPGRDISLWWRADRAGWPARKAVERCVHLAAVPALARIRAHCPASVGTISA
ncbi:LysR family transcriptional regulator [Streptomyces violens]|uniref:LysR family transcriptional regulator n=1 Tax=Streptomyces violens TaxID=66377 RepID=UPI00068D6FD2|nr:LysR family transcriptional regulator [Streptomyces violens]